MGKYTEVAQRCDGSHDCRLDGDRRQVIRAGRPGSGEYLCC